MDVKTPIYNSHKYVKGPFHPPPRQEGLKTANNTFLVNQTSLYSSSSPPYSCASLSLQKKCVRVCVDSKMVSRLVRWRWPTGPSKKFAVRVILRGIERLRMEKDGPEEETRVRAEVRWKGKTRAFRSLRWVRRNCTREDSVCGDGERLVWDEEFGNVVVLTEGRDGGFELWEIQIVVFGVRILVGQLSFFWGNYMHSTPKLAIYPHATTFFVKQGGI